jgi:competence protein ComEC
MSLLAAGFGLGCFVAARRPPDPVLGWTLLGGAAVLAVVVSVGGPGRRRRPSTLLSAAGLSGPPKTPAGPRERILAAARLPGRSPGQASSPGRVLALTIGVALGGAGWATVRAPPPIGPLDGRSVRFTGTATSDVNRQEWGWGLEVRLDRVAIGRRAVDAEPKVWATGSGPAPAIAAGQPVAGAGIVEALPRPAKDFEAYLLGRGVTARLRAFRLRALGPPTNPALRVANGVREAFRRGADRALSDRDGGLIRGLAIGDTEGMDPEVEEDFRATGLTHLLAVSGSNVALVMIPALAGAARLGIRRSGRIGVAAAVVGMFALVTRWEPSVLRATAMAVIGLAAMWAGRPRRVAPALAAAVLALLVADPLLATSAGFQLSVAATAGLAAMAGPLAARLSILPRPVAGSAAATIAAQVAVTPLLLLLFGTVPTVTLLANVLAFPAVAPALLLGSVASALALPWRGLGEDVGVLAEVPLGYLIGLADRLARFPLPSVTGGVAVAAGAAGLAVVVAWRLRRGRSPRMALAGAAVLALLGWSSAPSAGPPESLTVTFLDVGQGDAAVVRTPEGATLLIDAGPDPHVVATELAALGIRRIDLAVATHAHADHVEGFAAVLARYPIGVLLEPGCPGDSPSYRRFLSAVRDEGVVVRHPRGGRRFAVGRLVVEILGPDRCSPGGTSPNDDSVVLRLTYGRATALFPGDAEVPAQRDLLEDGDPIRAALLKVPHHGGDTSDPEFLDATAATVAVVSTGPNTYGHPHPDLLSVLRSEGMVVVRTDRVGDVTVSFDPNGSPVVASSS